MEVSRRDFLRVSSGVAGGTALGGLTGLGANLAPMLAADDDASTLRLLDLATVDLDLAALERGVADPDPAAFEGWLLARCLDPYDGASVGAMRAMALDVLAE